MMETIAPESAGMSAGRLSEIHTLMQSFVNQGKIAGISTLIARHGKVVHFGCYGKLDMDANKPITQNSLFRIYSLTKPITAVAALILSEEGYFRLDDPISKWIPAFTNFNVLQASPGPDIQLVAQTTEITFWHLLTHTAGLGYGCWPDPQEPIEKIYNEANLWSPNYFFPLRFSLPGIVQKVAQLPLVAQPGMTWHYSLAHDILGYLIELISGKPFGVFLRKRIFEPLGMPDTSFYVSQEKLDRFGPLYSAPGEHGLAVIDDVAASPFLHSDAVPSGGGGLVSTMTDYLRFLLMLANGGALDGVRVLQPGTVQAMTTNQLTGTAFPVRFDDEDPGMGYGLGIGVNVGDRQQVGWIGISGTTAWIYPREEMIAIAMPQALFYSEASDAFLKMALEAITA